MKKINTNSIIDGDKNGSHATPTALRESASPEETDVKTQEKDPPDTEKLSKPTHSPDVAYTAQEIKKYTAKINKSPGVYEGSITVSFIIDKNSLSKEDLKYKYTTDNTDPKTCQTAVIADDKNNPVITLKTGTNKIRVITLKNNKYIDETATMFTYIINEKKETNEIILNKKRGNLISNFTGSEATWDVGMMVADDYGYYYFASFGYDENEGYSFVSIVKTNDFSKPGRTIFKYADHPSFWGKYGFEPWTNYRWIYVFKLF